jgi:hypothetical protein
MVLFLIPSREPPLDNLNEIKPIPGGRPNQTKMAGKNWGEQCVITTAVVIYIRSVEGDISMYIFREN